MATVFLSKEVYIATTTIDYQDCTTTTKPQKNSNNSHPISRTTRSPHSLNLFQSIGLLFVVGGSIFIKRSLHCNYNHQLSRLQYNMHKESATTSAQSPCGRGMCCQRHQPDTDLTQPQLQLILHLTRGITSLI